MVGDEVGTAVGTAASQPKQEGRPAEDDDEVSEGKTDTVDCRCSGTHRPRPRQSEEPVPND